MRKTFATFLALLALTLLTIAWLNHSAPHNKRGAALSSGPSSPRKDPAFLKLKTKALAARKWAATHQFNTNICFLIDMSIASGKQRFFVYDLLKDTISKSGLVTHGNCNEYWLRGRKYGNAVGCGCTSLGKYKIGYPYVGRFGTAFKLYGLETGNSNAFARYVVLHAHSCVPDAAVSEDICQSNGCPTVSPDFLQKLAPIINGSAKPILLWIYE